MRATSAPTAKAAASKPSEGAFRNEKHAHLAKFCKVDVAAAVWLVGARAPLCSRQLGHARRSAPFASGCQRGTHLRQREGSAAGGVEVQKQASKRIHLGRGKGRGEGGH
jgi:hypothetical protein